MTLRIASFVLAACAYGQQFRITSGAVDEQVFQRNADGRANLEIGGVAPSGSTVEARLLLRNSPLAGLDWKPIAAAQNGVWSGAIRDVPAGGPYRLELRIPNATVAIRDLLVGDLWILAGQSNMEGYGDLVDVEPRHELVHSFDQTDEWVVAEEPLHRLVDAVDRVHWRRGAQEQPEKWDGERLQEFIRNRTKGVGFSRLHHLGFLKREPMLTGILQVVELPRQSTFWRFVAALHRRVAQQVLEVQRGLRQRVWEAAHVELTEVTLDTDTTVHTLFGNQMGARKGYNPKNKGKKSYQRMSSEGWCIQWESTPPGQKSEFCSLDSWEGRKLNPGSLSTKPSLGW